jgi:hypothetical protein
MTNLSDLQGERNNREYAKNLNDRTSRPAPLQGSNVFKMQIKVKLQTGTVFSSICRH